MTKLIVFGGTGKSGVAVIREALQQKGMFNWLFEEV